MHYIYINATIKYAFIKYKYKYKYNIYTYTMQITNERTIEWNDATLNLWCKCK